MRLFFMFCFSCAVCGGEWPDFPVSRYAERQPDIKTFITLAHLLDVLSGVKSCTCLC